VPSSLDDPQDPPWLESLTDAVSPLGRTRAANTLELLPHGDREERDGRAIRHAELLKRAEVRDVLAWMRLLTEPRDAAAAVRALARPPIELRQVDLARVIQMVRRQRLDVVAALTAAMESPQLPPPARERIGRFLELHRWAAGGLDTVRADLFVGRLIERLGLRRRQLLAADGEGSQRLAGVAGLCELAEEFVGSSPRPTARALAIHLTADSDPRRPNGGAQSDRPEAHPQTLDDAPRGTLQATLQMMRTEVLGDVARIAGRLGELRLDTEVDVAHGVVRYLELLKLAALAEHSPDRAVAEALADVNARLGAAMTPLQREIYETSPLDELLLAERSEGGNEVRARAQAVAARDEPTLEAFLPRRGQGLVLSASDVETYRSCPLRYKFARVLKIPSEQTVHQRFGIVVHQVLERFHAAAERREGAGDGDAEEGTLGELMDLLDAAWRRAGLGEGKVEGPLLTKARAALRRYHERLREEPARPLWFERSFAFSLGPHHVRGRVDRVDRQPDGVFELIDYKTGRPRSEEELSEDIQLSLYAIAAREAWDLGETRQAYYYVLDDRKVPVPRGADDAEWVREAVLEAGEGILAQQFEPTPSTRVCALCDYRIVCPVAEG
jgi:RecB family exonuclease